MKQEATHSSSAGVTISSLQNARIKELVKLSKRRDRDTRRVTVVEGAREIGHALAAGFVPQEVYLCPELATSAETQALITTCDRLVRQGLTTMVTVTPAVFAKIAYREESGGLLLVMPYVTRHLAQMSSSAAPFFAVIEGVEKPGNLGAILRTADAAGVDGVIVCAGATDVHNPNVVRASLGALFTVPIAEATTDQVIAWLQQHRIRIVAATPEGLINYTIPDYTAPVAVVMGSEAYGLAPAWFAAAADLVQIPMRGVVDSLNLSAATAILLYEVVRQRLAMPE
ncbi:MAG: RNA methyltransferase [Caldilineaceae bacterium]